MKTKLDLTIFKNLTLFFIFLIFATFLYKVQAVIIIFFGSFIITSALEPLIDLFNKKFSRKTSIILTGLTLVFILSVILFPLVRVIVNQIAQFITQLPLYLDSIIAYFSKSVLANNIVLKAYNLIGIHSSDQLFTKIGFSQGLSQSINYFSNIGKAVLNGSLVITSSIFTVLSFLSISMLLTTYFLFDKINIKKGLLKLFPEPLRNDAENITKLISKRISGFVIGQLIMMTIMGTMLSIGLFILGHNFPVATGTIAGLLDIVPVIGPLITAIIIIISSLAKSPILAIWSIILYVSIQWTSDTFIRPYIIGKFANIHPLVLIFSLLCGGILFGLSGVLLAPLLAIIVLVLAQELYIKKIN